MIEISESKAIQAMDENDLTVLEDELHLLKSSSSGKEQIERYFTDGDMIYLKVYWDGELVHKVSFTNNRKGDVEEMKKSNVEIISGLDKSNLSDGVSELKVVEVKQGKNTVRKLVSETNNQSFALSSEMINLGVIQDAVANLMDRIDDIKHKKWDEEPTMARLSIDEISSTVRLIDMAFQPLFLSLNKNINELENHASELFDIIVKQGETDTKKAHSAATE